MEPLGGSWSRKACFTLDGKFCLRKAAEDTAWERLWALAGSYFRRTVGVSFSLRSCPKWPGTGPGDQCPDRGLGQRRLSSAVTSQAGPLVQPSARCSGLHLHAGRRLLGHHEATSPFDAVVLVLLGAAREVASPLRLRGGSCQMRKSPRQSTDFTYTFAPKVLFLSSRRLFYRVYSNFSFL